MVIQGRTFVRKLLEWDVRDHEGLVEWIEARRHGYIRLAKKKIDGGKRDLVRIHGKFATIYAAGALAGKFQLLPRKRKELLAAIRKCETDHVAFVASEMRGTGKTDASLGSARSRRH